MTPKNTGVGGSNGAKGRNISGQSNIWGEGRKAGN